MSRRHRTAAEQIRDALGIGDGAIPDDWYAETLRNAFVHGLGVHRIYVRRGNERAEEQARAQARIREAMAREEWERRKGPTMLHRCEHCGIFSLDPETCTHQ